MLGAAWCQLAFQYLASSLRAFGRFRPVSIAHALQAAVGGGIGVLLVWSHGAWGLLWGWIAGSALALLVMRRAVPEAPLRPAQPRQGLSLARAGLPIFAYFATTLALRSVDRLALLRFGGHDRLGLYAIGLMAAGMVLYLPEAAAYVLFPRMAAAAHGARDPVATRMECVRAQRALAVTVPLLVAIGIASAGPVVSALLPDYRGGLPALRALAIGAAMMSAATIPGYSLLAAGRFRALLSIGVAATLADAAGVGFVAFRTRDPGSVALAAAAGYTLFAAGIIAAAAREWFAGAAERAQTLAAGLVPGAWVGLASWLASRLGSDASWTAASLRAVAVTAVYLPVLWWFGRGAGIASLVREWMGRRRAPPLEE
jgi:O-antigen/teichoic acid export membrane protein